jgi:RNA polymerase sigma-70 factor (ECF subfamily)
MGPGTDMDQQRTQLTGRFMAERHALMAYIHALVQRAEVAEDIFQEVWLRLADAAERGVAIDDPPRWFRGVARNLVLHHWRSEQRSRVIVDSGLLDLIDQAFSEQDELHDALASRRLGLRACISELPEHAKEVLRLTYVVDLSAEAVAAKLERTSASVLMMLSRLRRSLEECVNRRLRGQEEPA